MNTVCVENKPVAPGKIVCVGRNYVKHIEELNNAIPDQMVVFHKSNSSISSQLQAVHEEPLHYEAEICFVIEDGQYAAVGLGLDLTKRTLQSYLKEKGLPWERAKAFDGAAVLSDFVTLDSVDIDDLNLELFIDGELVQKGHVSQMLYPPKVILQELASYTTLQDNDIVMTGTPSGVGVVKRGSVFSGKVLCGDKVLIEAEWTAQ